MSLISEVKSLPFKAAFKPLMVPDAILPFDKLCTAPLPALTPKLKINKAYKPSVTNFIVFGSLENTPNYTFNWAFKVLF